MSVNESVPGPSPIESVEIYVLCCDRSSLIASRFLAEFAPSRLPLAAGYPYPEFASEPTEHFQSTYELIRRLEAAADASYSIYWSVQRGGLSRQVMLFFTEDGAMIAGVGDPVVPAEVVLRSMRTTVEGDYGFLTSGSPPPSSVEEFKDLCRDSSILSLFEGRIRFPTS